MACLHTHLLLLFRGAAQQHVKKDMRQQIDGDLVVVLDDETAATKDFTSQLVSHLEHIQSESETCNIDAMLNV